jgi:hypothetical protein
MTSLKLGENPNREGEFFSIVAAVIQLQEQILEFALKTNF